MHETVPFADPDASDSATVCANDVLVRLMANGLARIGFESTLQGSPKSVRSVDGTSWIDDNYWLSGKGNMFEVDLTQSKDWLKSHVISNLEGYAYNTSLLYIFVPLKETASRRSVFVPIRLSLAWHLSYGCRSASALKERRA